ncbi:hypothetical protein BT63DRAFT_424162 [Microthyrium microscopicum]|uniref:Uncharacterized protein n=1 Tax=Microthyrium microscopicum TaxID=703497 RepID=A0A6A6UFJ0_9PEZI|nr:hypothetical protein BT63DRAFT_424162 [Microthyrium microscopicum]
MTDHDDEDYCMDEYDNGFAYFQSWKAQCDTEFNYMSDEDWEQQVFYECKEYAVTSFCWDIGMPVPLTASELEARRVKHLGCPKNRCRFYAKEELAHYGYPGRGYLVEPCSGVAAPLIDIEDNDEGDSHNGEDCNDGDNSGDDDTESGGSSSENEDTY